MYDVLLIVVVSFCIGSYDNFVINDDTNDPCPVDYPLHTSKQDYRGCCANVRCKKGEQPRLCPRNYTPAVCVRCGEDFYQSDETMSYLMRSCILKTSCNLNEITVSDGSVTEDRTCACNVEMGFYRKRDFGECGYVICPRNTELHLNGDCVPCEGGNSSVNSFGLERCELSSATGVSSLTTRIDTDSAHSTTDVDTTSLSTTNFAQKNDQSGDIEWQKSTAKLTLIGASTSVTVAVVLLTITALLTFKICARRRRSKNGKKYDDDDEKAVNDRAEVNPILENREETESVGLSDRSESVSYMVEIADRYQGEEPEQQEQQEQQEQLEQQGHRVHRLKEDEQQQRRDTLPAATNFNDERLVINLPPINLHIHQQLGSNNKMTVTRTS